jgi:muramoyltetrapeptide carboxypeptidase
MKIPPYLKKGDTIGIVAVARKVEKEHVSSALEIFKNWGLEVKLGNNLYKSADQFAGSDAERASDLQQMLDDDQVKAVISVRGGYGTLRIIDLIDFKKFEKNPKWIIGYSDITVLHSHLLCLGVASLHATMPVNFMCDAEATLSLRDSLFGNLPEYVIDGSPLNRSGIAEAELAGGNLSLLYSLKGSISDADTDGKILFIEDLDEYLYHIDRMIISLKRAGKLKNLAGLVVGGMTDMKDNTVPFGKSAQEIIRDAVAEYDFPVCFQFPAGHIDKNMALIMGKKVRLEVAANRTSLTYI